MRNLDRGNGRMIGKSPIFHRRAMIPILEQVGGIRLSLNHHGIENQEARLSRQGIDTHVTISSHEQGECLEALPRIRLYVFVQMATYGHE